MPEEPNYLLSPSHPDFPRIAITEPEKIFRFYSNPSDSKEMSET